MGHKKLGWSINNAAIAYKYEPHRQTDTTKTAVNEWVRALDWLPGGTGFESRCGIFASELWQIRLPRNASVFRMIH